MPDGMTGHLFEVAMFGRCRPCPGGYLPWRKAAAQASRHQPFQKTRFTARIEQLVGKEIGAEVRFFTAVGTSFDIYHGVDGFIVTATGLIITFDLTCNPHKDCWKADMILDEKDCCDLPQLAGRIARELRSQIGRNNPARTISIRRAA